ncbi:hypothetical protein CHCC5025_1148 [Bacillus licheniformis]|nr:hypothetical protein CHCC5025_1148 [Bacillus licheniformis]
MFIQESIKKRLDSLGEYFSFTLRFKVKYLSAKNFLDINFCVGGPIFE